MVTTGDDLRHQVELYAVRHRLVIVDNDPASGAGTTAEEISAVLGWPLHHEIEPEAGIPAARRRTVPPRTRSTL